MKKEPIYIFVSHSHKDLDGVRVIRNYLESLGAEPILFFLKSQNDKRKITKLIEEEIDARIWFIYCKSENAEVSTWVKSEREYAAKTNKKEVLTIDLEDCIDENNNLKLEWKNAIDEAFIKIKLLRNIYIACASFDRVVVNKIVSYLSNYGINLFYVEKDLRIALDWEEQMVSELDDSTIYLVFVSNNGLSAAWLNNEIQYALKHEKTVLPVFLESETEKIQNNPIELSAFDPYHFDINNIEESSIKLVNHLMELLKVI